MEPAILWSLRLGFSARQAESIQKNGIADFLQKSVTAPFTQKPPDFMASEPKSLAELRQIRQQIKNTEDPETKAVLKKQIQNGIAFKAWWINEIQNSSFPLREKMVLFWHNHFVATQQKVKVNWWIYQHNQLLREMAFGNFKTLTKAVLQTNAMVRYLDNVDNQRGALNENLSRELLELFTLGIGHYTENDVKMGAKALAGLHLGEHKAQYRPRLEDPDTITYLGKTGQFKVEDLVDRIFEQPAVPYLITRKLLQWFIYDSPPEELVTYYGDYFRSVQFEIQPLLQKILVEEYAKPTAGSKIKNPLEFILQLHDELHISNPNENLLVFFLRQQGMDLCNQPNVKGWIGGKSWLTSQIYLQRQHACDLLCRGKELNRRILKELPETLSKTKTAQEYTPKVAFNPNHSASEIKHKMTQRLVFQVDEDLQKQVDAVLKYDFNAKDPNAQEAVMRLFLTLVKSPEFQLI